MTEKSKVKQLQTLLAKKDKQLKEYKTNTQQLQAKIKAELVKNYSDKIKSLLNTIDSLKKDKAGIDGLAKEHKRSDLIKQINKEIQDQDLVIQVLRKYVYDKEGKEKGRQICDGIIVAALKKGPEQVRALTRQQLKMEIEKLKSNNVNLEPKLKASLVKVKNLQLDNENLQAQLNSKNKLIEQLQKQSKENQKVKAQIEFYKNQIDNAYKKIFTFQKLMKESRDTTNNKMMELYEKEIKLNQIQTVEKQNNDKLKLIQLSYNILVQQVKLQKETVENQLQQLKKQSEQLIQKNKIEKKKQEQQKNIINEIKDLNLKHKDQLKDKLEEYEKQIEKIMEQNKKYLQSYRKIEKELFSERAKWVQQKMEIVQQMQKLKANSGSNQNIQKYLQQIDKLTIQNKNLREMLENSKGKGDDHILLQRLEAYEKKIEHLQRKNKGQSKQQILSQQAKAYEQLFVKYNELAKQFENLKLNKDIEKHDKKIKHKEVIQISKKQQNIYDNMSSGIQSLNLANVDSDILDNFDTSYEYEIQVNQDGKKVKVLKVTDADKQLLKLLSSDLWYFVKNQQNQLDMKINEAVDLAQSDRDYEDKYQLREKAKKLTNLNHPRGKKITLYQQELQEVDKMSEKVSVTSALEKQLDKFNSDLDIEMKKIPYNIPTHLNLKNINKVSLSSGSDLQLSSAKSGDSNIRNKKNNQKATILGLKNKKLEKISSDIESVNSINEFNSDVSSININQSQFDKTNSDIQLDFKKVKK